MKSLLICLVCGACAFAGMHLFMTPGVVVSGSEAPPPHSQTEPKPEANVEGKKSWAAPLASATKLQPVEDAAEWLPQGNDIPRIAVLDHEGKLHPWHASLPTEWRAESALETGLVLVVGQVEKKSTGNPISAVGFESNSPREWSRDVYLIEARAGKVLKSLRFVHKSADTPGPNAVNIAHVDDTASREQVVQWVKSQVFEIMQEAAIQGL